MLESKTIETKTPAQLFEECSAAQGDACRFDLTPLKFALAKALLFGQPLFEPSPVVEHKPSFMNKNTYLKIRREFEQANKYRDLLNLLRECNQKNRLFVIAWWLKQEGVCEPEDILGSEEIRKLTRKRLGFLSTSEFKNANRVRAWLPYFERLLRDLGNRSRSALVRLGYEGTAVEAARGKRSAVEAACNWLADREPICDALTLRNAFSKIYGPHRLRRKGGAVLENSR